MIVNLSLLIGAIVTGREASTGLGIVLIDLFLLYIVGVYLGVLPALV